MLKQDRLSILESQLDKLDEEEQALLFLGKSRSDTNAKRAAIVANIEDHLKDYGRGLFSISTLLLFSSHIFMFIHCNIFFILGSLLLFSLHIIAKQLLSQKSTSHPTSSPVTRQATPFSACR